MPAIIGALQTGRNTVQATRINVGQQVRSAFGGMGGGGRLALQNNDDAIVTPDESDVVAGPMGLWPFPLLNAIKGGVGTGAAPPADTETVGLGVPSGIASVPGARGVASFDPSRAATGQRVW